MYPALFECPDCGAQYKVARQEAADNQSNHPAVKCLTCGRPLDPGDGKFVLKYFRVKHSRREHQFQGAQQRG